MRAIKNRGVVGEGMEVLPFLSALAKDEDELARRTTVLVLDKFLEEEMELF